MRKTKNGSFLSRLTARKRGKKRRLQLRPRVPALETLTLDVGSLTVPTGFSVPTPFASSVAPGGSTTLVIRLDAAAEGYFGGDVSFATNDSDEDPFDFHVHGNVVPPAPEISVSAEDDYGSTYELYSGSNWVYFDSTAEGAPVSETFTIENTGTGDLTLDANSLSVPDGFSVGIPFATTVAPNESTTLTIQLDAALAGYYGGAVSFGTNDSDENPFQFYVSGDVTSGGGGSPEIMVRNASYDEVSDDMGSVDVGQTTVGTPISYTFTIENQSDSELTLDSMSLSLPAGFSVMSWFDETVYSYSQTYLTVQLDAASVGAHGGELSFTTNDPDENPFNFTLSGDVTGPTNSPPVVASPLADVTVDEDSFSTSIDLGSVFDDPDLGQGDSLTYTIGSNGNEALVQATISGQQLTLTYAPDGNGAATIAVVATDSHGACRVSIHDLGRGRMGYGNGETRLLQSRAAGARPILRVRLRRLLPRVHGGRP
jgi:hypothetical protein